MQKSWSWLFIGRLVVLLAFTPEVWAAKVAASDHPILNPEAAPTLPSKGPPLVLGALVGGGAAAAIDSGFLARSTVAILPKQQDATMALGGRF
jgi:hypothetical protein